tara:strand:- start:381 stop:1025 length:645 start_codon:yes stop_codon:yes gene_type:complete
MEQIYVVFMLNRRVTFYESATKVSPKEGGALSFWNPDKKQLKDLTKLFKTNLDIREVDLYSDDVEKMWMRFCMNYFEVVSAGGLVINQKGNALWIMRNRHWDLPKGKVERGEMLEAAALREVTEETGISGLKITGDITATYHTYEIDGVVHLKTTFWYSMEHSAGDSMGVPQSIEGITDVKWMSLPVPKNVWDSTYGSIRVVVETAMANMSKEY